MLEVEFDHDEDHWLLKSEKACELVTQLSHTEVTTHDVRHLLAKNRTALLNHNISDTQEQYKDAPAILSQNLLRRNKA